MVSDHESRKISALSTHPVYCLFRVRVAIKISYFKLYETVFLFLMEERTLFDDVHDMKENLTYICFYLSSNTIYYFGIVHSIV